MKFFFEDNKQFTVDWTVPYFLCDPDKRLTLAGLIRMWTDTSMRQYEVAGLTDMEEGRAWVIYSWDIQILKMPVSHEPVRTVTRAYRFDRFFGKRNFLLLDREDRVLAYADSLWLLIDREKMRPVRLGAKEGAIFNQGKPFYEKSRPSLEDLNTYRFQHDIIIRKSDIDENRHVNNAAIIDWILDYLPDSCLPSEELRAAVICYRKQIFEGERVSIEFEPDREGRLHARIGSGADTRVIAFLEYEADEDGYSLS